MQVRKQQLELNVEQQTSSKLGKKCVIGRTDAEAEAPILWPSKMKRWFIGKDPDSGKD